MKYRVNPDGDKVMVKTAKIESEGRETVEEDTMEMLNEVDGVEFVAEAKELLLSSTPTAYREGLTTIMGQVERAARSQELSVTLKAYST